MTDAQAARHAALAALAAGPFDLLVVGGGINGAGIARDAALRGLRTALVERGDLGSGTSSASSKLVHGGFRYLEQGHIRLVLQACRERERLRRLAPHLVRPQRFLFPVYAGGPVSRAKLALGLWAYDLLAGWWQVHRHRMLSAAAVRRVEPALRTEGLRGGGLYWDARTDDARLVLETALAAAEAGAVIVSYAEVTGFLKEAGRIVGARVRERLGGNELDVRARVVVNASGPWMDAVATLDEPGPPRLRLTKGVHLVVIPWGEHALIGTTDTDQPGGPDAPCTVEPDDVAYLLETVNHYFPAARLAPADVVSAFAGLRPLVAPEPGRRFLPSDVSREEAIFVSRAGLISLAGGKLTTYRLVAAEVVDRVIAALGRLGDPRRFGRCRCPADGTTRRGSPPRRSRATETGCRRRSSATSRIATGAGSARCSPSSAATAPSPRPSPPRCPIRAPRWWPQSSASGRSRRKTCCAAARTSPSAIPSRGRGWPRRWRRSWPAPSAGIRHASGGRPMPTCAPWRRRGGGGGERAPGAGARGRGAARRDAREPRRPARPRAGDRARARAGVSGRLVRPPLPHAVGAARGHHPLGAVHRQDGEHGHPGAVCRVSNPGRAGGGGSRARRGARQAHGILPAEDEEPPCRRPRDRHRARRRGARVARGAHGAPGHRAQDRERRARHGVRSARDFRGHPCAPARGPTRLELRGRSRPHRAGSP